MKSGYKLFWSDSALNDLQNIIDYLVTNWTLKEIRHFSKRLETRLNIIIQNPRLFPSTGKRKKIRKSVLSKHTVIYYQISGNQVIIAALFDPRQDPKKLKI